MQLCGDLDSTAELKCKWDPSGRYLVVLPTWYGWDNGDAAIWDTSTAEKLSVCYIRAAAYWPQWCQTPSVNRLGVTQIDSKLSEVTRTTEAGLQQCFTHQPAGLVTMPAGESTFRPCGGRWSQMSPDGSLIATMLARLDELNPSRRSAHAFQHHHTATAHEASVTIGVNGHGNGASPGENRSHPFLCAWFPGTTIYAAAALGWVYIVDGRRDAILQMWPADESEDLAEMEYRCPSQEPWFAGLSWSPDGLKLAWLDQLNLHIISFA